eukprot:3986848-Prymnesium_polylepis.1
MLLALRVGRALAAKVVHHRAAQRVRAQAAAAQVGDLGDYGLRGHVARGADANLEQPHAHLVVLERHLTPETLRAAQPGAAQPPLTEPPQESGERGEGGGESRKGRVGRGRGEKRSVERESGRVGRRAPAT